MSDENRTLFVQYPADESWTEEQIETLRSNLIEVVPDDVGVVIVPHSVEFLTEQQVEEFTGEIVEALSDDE